MSFFYQFFMFILFATNNKRKEIIKFHLFFFYSCLHLIFTELISFQTIEENFWILTIKCGYNFVRYYMYQNVDDAR